MITAQDIINWSKPHHVPDARCTKLDNGHVIVSIVGGAKGVYGDFDETFEVAIFDRETKDFLTNIYYEGNSDDDVIPYLNRDELEQLVNKVLPGSFQVL